MNTSTSLITSVVRAPDPRLRIKTKPVKKITPALYKTMKDMIALTKTFKDPEGVGLAATQVGLKERFFVARLHQSNKSASWRTPAEPGQRKDRWTGYDKDFVSIINPKILSFSKKTRFYFEGCLSTPSIWGQVKRYISIKVSYKDIGGKEQTKILKGIPAWIFQHEVDHLDGILFQDRVLKQKGKFYKFTGKDKTGTDIFEEITL